MAEAPILAGDCSNWKQVYRYNYHKLLHCDMLSRSFFCAMFVTVLTVGVKVVLKDRDPLSPGTLTVLGMAWLAWARQNQFAKLIDAISARIASGKK